MTAIASQPELDVSMGQEDLRALLEAITSTTEQLQSTHTALHQQVAGLKQELAEANERLRRARSLAALGEMAAGIAHELRNPLGSIQLYVQMLTEDLEQMPPQRDVCKKISAAVSGLDAIIEDVLTFARDTTVRAEPFLSSELISRTLEMCAGLIQEAAVEVTCDVAELELVGDQALLTQALGNIVRNAIEAMREAGVEPQLQMTAEARRVRCSDGKRSMCIVFGVRDNGPGIPEEAKNRIFNPFFTTRASGTGLGLAIVHRIVDGHGGQIDVTNQPEGGACVELFLPPKQPMNKNSRTIAGIGNESDGSLSNSVRRRIHQEGAT